MTAKVPLKETALNAERIARIGREVHAACPEFDADKFVTSVMADLPRLELGARIARTSEGLHTYLPVTGSQALDVLLRSLPPTPEAAGVPNDFGLHTYSPYSHFVARYLRTGEYLDQALAALARLTRYFSAEVAVRHFLNDFPEETMKAVNAWARDEDYRTRRLASEATRPLLPCAPRISLPADAALPVLEQLYGDSSTYVRASVANHLHDLSDTQPDLVLATLQRWKDSGRAADKHFTFIARQALRSRLKKGWPAAYAFLGYAHDAPIDLSPLTLERTELTEGDTLSFSATLTTTAAVPVHVMFVISSTTPTGKPREKVYFLLRGTAEPRSELLLTKDHVLRSTATAKLTPGAYSIALQVNGRRFPAAAFTVLTP
ncbi:DNA alkylation repair protein [Streptomyces actuosus]|uniref:DNA alkylation repair protein n=1 Tax=Streptomyces actuosus TaxID=1885 RepID=A0ABS2VRC0_STRAS|nr:DNA alkylation repair protein [Streptomyces actuosus]MBN0045662.1 DNA alkylation repair protein [Streptomyces actuosus]